jgi:hypothetical protein
VPAEDEEKGIAFLEKPFTYALLVQKVAALLALPDSAAADGSRAADPKKAETEVG